MFRFFRSLWHWSISHDEVALAEEIKIVSVIEVVTAGKCLICGEQLDGLPLLECPDCKTWHHQECWDFNFGCATYACRRRRAFSLESMLPISKTIGGPPPAPPRRPKIGEIGWWDGEQERLKEEAEARHTPYPFGEPP